MKTSLITTVLLLFGLIFSVQAQNKSIPSGYASSGMGIGIAFPNYGKQTTTKNWKNFQYKQNFLDLYYSWGQYKEDGLGDNEYKDSSNFGVGVNFPLHKITPIKRRHTLGLLHVTPLIGVQYTANSLGKNLGQHGVNVSPTLSFQLPLVMVDLRLDNSYYFGGKDEVKNIRSNFVMTPSINVKFDGLFEVLGGSTVESGTFSYNRTYHTGSDEKYVGGGEYERTDYYHTVNHQDKVFRSLQRSFWFVSAKYHKGIDALAEDGSNYNAGNGYGVGIGGRASFFLADVNFERNNGYYATRDPSLVEALSEVAGDYPFVEGSFNATEIKGKVGLNAGALVAGILMPKSHKGIKNLGFDKTKFTRLNFGLSGAFSMPGKVNIETPEGMALLDDFFAKHPQITRDHSTDISKTKAGFTYGAYWQWEMGPMSLMLDYHGNADFGYRLSGGISYLLPIFELL